jgi:hypothetical protein
LLTRRQRQMCIRDRFIPVRFKPEKSSPARFFFEQFPFALSVQPFAFAAFSAEMTTAFGSVAVVVSAAEVGPANETTNPVTRVATKATFFERFIFTPINKVKCNAHLIS